MKSYKCEILEKTLNFLPNKVNFCCSYAEGLNVSYVKDKNFNFADIKKNKKKYINQLKFGKIPAGCYGCIDYKEKKYTNILDFFFTKSDTSLIKQIIVNHYKQCDCNCIYCTQRIIWDGDYEQNYELLPIIQDLYEHNAIDKDNLQVEFQGGDVTALNEFESLMRLFMKNGCKCYDIHTNLTKYLPVLEELPFQSLLSIQISLDSGTKETYRKIKQIDALEQVLDNIKMLSIKTNAIINLKYIIIKDVNDNSYEVNQFLELVKELRCVNEVSFDIDYRDIVLYKDKKFEIPSYYYDIVKQAEDFCRENRIMFCLKEYAKMYMEKK